MPCGMSLWESRKDVSSFSICNEVFDELMAHRESRMAKNDLAFATVESCRKILDDIRRPEIGEEIFEQVRYSRLVEIADARHATKKTYDNVISPLRCALEHGYRDHPEKHNRAAGLKGFRIAKKDRPAVDPLTFAKPESLIAATREDRGEARANYDEFRLFTGLQPSEQIALLVSDCDLSQGKISVTKARSLGAVETHPAAPEGALPRSLQRAALIREMESDDRQ